MAQRSGLTQGVQQGAGRRFHLGQRREPGSINRGPVPRLERVDRQGGRVCAWGEHLGSGHNSSAFAGTRADPITICFPPPPSRRRARRPPTPWLVWLRRWGCRRPQVPGQEGDVRRHVRAMLSLSRQEVLRCRVQAAGLSLGDSRLFPAATWAASEGGRHSSLRDWAGGEMRAECSGRRQLGGEMRSHSRGRLQLSGFPGRSQKWAESVRFL